MCTDYFPGTHCLTCNGHYGPTEAMLKKVKYEKCEIVQQSGLAYGACGKRETKSEETEVAKCKTCKIREAEEKRRAEEAQK
ncbi:hypothetical protein HJFPF1_08189 [Paramyrothecium foliicola]|nr:hypothetical protein HJFPF1_08189 [Paramyrothecium foliicola]